MAHRSAVYPRVSLKETLEFIKQLTGKYGEGKISRKEAMEALGVTSNTSSFVGRISTAQQYGLISSKESVIGFTDKAVNYLHPLSDSSLEEQRLALIQSPVLYKKLLQQLVGHPLPTLGVLSNLLVLNYNILASASDKAAQIFIDSLKYAGAIEVKSNLVVLDHNDNVKNVVKADEKVDVEHSEIVDEDFGNSEKNFVQVTSVMPGRNAMLSIPWDYNSDNVSATMKVFDILIKEAESQFNDN